MPSAEKNEWLLRLGVNIQNLPLSDELLALTPKDESSNEQPLLEPAGAPVRVKEGKPNREVAFDPEVAGLRAEVERRFRDSKLAVEELELNETPEGQRLSVLLDVVRSSIDKQQFNQAGEGLDLIQGLLDEASRQLVPTEPDFVQGNPKLDDVKGPTKGNPKEVSAGDLTRFDTRAGKGDEVDAKGIVGIGPEDILPIIPDVINEITDRRATCQINNSTQLVLRLDGASFDEIDEKDSRPGIAHGKYLVLPPSQVAAGDQSARFGAQNKKLGPLSTTGVEARVRYLLDEQGTAWVFHFMNSFNSGNAVDGRVEGPNAANFQTLSAKSGTNDVKFLFALQTKGGAPVPPNPNPNPNPTPIPPGPVPGVASSCQISITNNTQLPLNRAEAEHERGDFMTLVPNTIAPGATINVVSVETPNAKEQGCKGFITWEIGSPMVALWRVEWDNPEGGKNSSIASVTPQTAGFKSTDQIGQGEENVPAQFVLSGGGGGGVQPVPPSPIPVPPGPLPVPPKPIEPEPAFEPPVKSKQPTLRVGDKSEDKWVEYAQMLLNLDGETLQENGVFDNKMLQAVLKFQKEHKLQVDGVIGNQTWAALREGEKEAVGTDGRAPHSFVEHGVEARWVLESETGNLYEADTDTLRLAVESVGDQPLDKSTEATIRITPPGGTAKTMKVKIGDHTIGPKSKSFTHEVRIPAMRKNFPSVPPDAPVTEYLVEAYLPKELGGDFYSGKVRESK